MHVLTVGGHKEILQKDLYHKVRGHDPCHHVYEDIVTTWFRRLWKRDVNQC